MTHRWCTNKIHEGPCAGNKILGAKWLRNEGKKTRSGWRLSWMIQSSFRLIKSVVTKANHCFFINPGPLSPAETRRKHCEEKTSLWAASSSWWATDCLQPEYWKAPSNKSQNEIYFIKHNWKNLNIVQWNDALFCVIACLINSRQAELTFLALNYCQAELFCEVELNQQFTYKN